MRLFVIVSFMLFAIHSSIIASGISFFELKTLKTHNDYLATIARCETEGLQKCWNQAVQEDKENENSVCVDKIKHYLLYCKQLTSPKKDTATFDHKTKNGTLHIPYTVIDEFTKMSLLGITYDSYDKGSRWQPQEWRINDIMSFYCRQLGNCTTYQKLCDKINLIGNNFPDILSNESGPSQNMIIYKGITKNRIQCSHNNFHIEYTNKNYCTDQFKLHDNIVVMPKKNEPGRINICTWIKQRIVLPQGHAFKEAIFIPEKQLQITTTTTVNQAIQKHKQTIIIAPLKYTNNFGNIDAEVVHKFFFPLHNLLKYCGHFQLESNGIRFVPEISKIPKTVNPFKVQGIFALMNALQVKSQHGSSNKCTINLSNIQDNDIAPMLQIIACLFDHGNFDNRAAVTELLLAAFARINNIFPEQIGTLPDGWKYDQRSSERMVTIFDSKCENFTILTVPIYQQLLSSNISKFINATNPHEYLIELLRDNAITFCVKSCDDAHAICITRSKASSLIDVRYNNTLNSYIHQKHGTPEQSFSDEELAEISDKKSCLEFFDHRKFLVRSNGHLYLFKHLPTVLLWKKIQSTGTVIDFGLKNNGWWVQCKEDQNLVQNVYNIYSNDGTKPTTPTALSGLSKTCIGLLGILFAYGMYIKYAHHFLQAPAFLTHFCR